MAVLIFLSALVLFTFLFWRKSPTRRNLSGNVRQVIAETLGQTGSRLTLEALAKGFAAATGERFFSSLVTTLGETLKLDYVLVGQLLEGSDRVRTVAVYANGALADNFEYDLRGTPCENVVHQHLCCYEKDVRTLFPQDRLLVEMGCDGYVGTPLFDAKGTALGLICAMTRGPLKNPALVSITLEICASRAAAELERKQWEEALLASEQRYRELFENANDIVYTHDLQGRFTSLNRAGERITGYSRQEALQLRIEDILTPQSIEIAKKMIRRKLKGLGSTTYEVEVIAKDGRRVPLEISTRLIRDRLGNPVEVQGVARDVTERRQLEQQLLQSQKMEAVGQLAGGVAHDFNNLLTAIIGYSDLLLEGWPPPASSRAHLLEIRRAADRAANLTNQLLAFSRRQMLKPQAVDLTQTAAHLEGMLSRVIGEHIELRLEGSSGCWAQVDPTQMDQVLMNLVLNARDAMPEGGKIWVRTGKVHLREGELESCPAGEYVFLQVSDSGSGMDEETRRRIFEPFFTTKATGKGTGLGLAMVYGIVKQSGGSIHVESELQQGSTFTVYLPALPPQGDPPAKDEPLRAPAQTAPGTSILVAEDEDSIRRYLRQILEVKGYRVFEARNGQEAWQLARKNYFNFQLLISDLVMPEMNGWELVERLRSWRPDLRVIYISGYADEELRQKGLLRSDICFIQKPFEASTLYARIQQLLQGDKAQQSG